MTANKPIYAPTESSVTGAPLFSVDPSIGTMPTAPYHHANSVAANVTMNNPYAYAAAQQQQHIGMMMGQNVTVGNLHQRSAFYNKPVPASAAATTTHQQLQQQHQQMMMLNAMHLQQQQQQQMQMAMQQQQQMMQMNNQKMMMGSMMPQQQQMTVTPPSSTRSSRSPMNANGSNAPTAGSGNNNGTRGPSTPFNPAAAMPLEDMILAYNSIKAREIELQTAYAADIAGGAEVAPFASPFVDYACSQQGKLVLQGLLHFEDEVAVAHDLFLSIGDAIETIALNEHGCHVIRALGEKIGTATFLEAEDGTPVDPSVAAAKNEAALMQFIAALHETLFLNICTLSQESRRIPQALFETYNAAKPDLFTPLVDIVARNVLYLSATQQGCIAFMRMYEASNYNQKRHMAASLVRIIADLSCDSFGNYVVQCLVEHSEIHVAAQYISSAFVGQCVRLACNKFASNVMEKSIRKLSHIPSVRRVILEELVFDHTNATICCEDAYANFVVQTLIETSSNAAEFRKIHDRVKAAVANSMYAAKIEARLRSKNFFTNGGNSATSSQISAAGVPNNATVVAPIMVSSMANVMMHSSGNMNVNLMSSAPTGSAPMNVIVGAPSSVVIGSNATNNAHNNTPVMAAMMAAATAAAQQMKSNTTTNVSATTPVYNTATAPVSPLCATSNNTKNSNGLPTDAAIVVGAPTKRNTGAEKDNKNNSRNKNNRRGGGGNDAEHEKENVKQSSSAFKAADPLQVEAKRLLNSETPSSFTPYKPSPFHDRSNRQNNAMNSTVSNMKNESAICKKPAVASSPRGINNNNNQQQQENQQTNNSSSPRTRNSNSNNSAPRRQGYQGRREQMIVTR